MKFAVPFGFLLLLCVLPSSALADDSATDTSSSGQIQNTVDAITNTLNVHSIVLGIGYDQGTFKMFNDSGTTKIQMTDNGRAVPVLDYVSPEHVLARVPMRYGDAVLGLNFTGSFGEQNTSYENLPGGSAIIGQNVGSRVSGDYLAGAPFIYLRLGPIYPDSDSYWLFGYGLGVALWHFSGNPIFYIPSGNNYIATSMPVSSTAKLFLYQTWRWQFHFGHWDVRFDGSMLNNRKIDGLNTSFENYGIGFAYTIHF